MVDDEERSGKDSMPQIIRTLLSLKDLTLPNSYSSISAALILSPCTSAAFPKFFSVLFGLWVWGQWWVGLLDVERAR